MNSRFGISRLIFIDCSSLGFLLVPDFQEVTDDLGGCWESSSRQSCCRPVLPEPESLHRESKNKTLNSCSQLPDMLTDFQNYFDDRLTGKFATQSCLNIPPHLKYVGTLYCEI